MNQVSTVVLLRLQLTILICLLGIIGCQSVPVGEANSAGSFGAASQTGRPPTERSASSIIKATPYYFAGEHRGFRLYPISDPVAFEALGFRPGDLLFEVEGRMFGDQQAPVELFASLDRGDTVAVKVRREDRIVELSLKLN